MFAPASTCAPKDSMLAADSPLQYTDPTSRKSPCSVTFTPNYNYVAARAYLQNYVLTHSSLSISILGRQLQF